MLPAAKAALSTAALPKAGIRNQTLARSEPPRVTKGYTRTGCPGEDDCSHPRGSLPHYVWSQAQVGLRILAIRMRLSDTIRSCLAIGCDADRTCVIVPL